MKNKDVQLVEIQSIATVATKNFQVWWALVNRVLPLHASTIDLYSDFFGTVTDSCKRVIIIELHRLIEDRKDVNSMHTFIQDNAANHPEIKKRYDDLTVLHASTIAAIRRIRHNAVAHQNKALTVQKTFQDAALTPNEIRDLLVDLVALLRDLISICQPGAGNITESLRYENETMGLIQHIGEWQRESPKENRRIWLQPPFLSKE
jgi:hypothetical protein